ncbi:TPA: hypothetical protein ACN1M9_002643 [Enterococcus faecalis]|uniref:hypothetical protein n=1 Tax=Enterococcus TaxID=1350 RepID=UPI0008339206|nr:hypothetical protein [Enterococcus canis]HBI1562913.1 hypothetical protein [Enterococcus faecalis]HBI1566041.1 hypothetical protein [Enterococcus faecalis]HBI1770309.1 hypothetical protein [Enterococcus faecalis]
MEDKKSKRLFRLTDIYISIICLTPSLWLIMGLFTPISRKEQLISTVMSIPCLFFLGFVFGRNSRDKEVFDLASEADELENELKNIKNEKKQNKE